MKRLTIPVLLVLGFFSTSAQNPCLKGGITFSSQEEIDDFQSNYPGCTRIEGSVCVSGHAINNLQGLGTLTAIGGNLQISGNDQLKDLSGLENLSHIGGGLLIGGPGMSNGNAALQNLHGLENLSGVEGWLLISYNDVLSNIGSLGKLDSIGGCIDINNNPALVHLEGLGNIRSAMLVAIYQNNALSDLSGLDHLRWIDLELFIGQNNALTSIHGLNNLEAVAGLVDIWDNPVLGDLCGLNRLTSIGGYLWISENDSLKSLTGLESLVSISGEIALNGNLSLTSLLGLGNIPAPSIRALSIYDNNSLSDCALENICSYLSNPKGSCTFYQNAAGCNTAKEIMVACEPSSNEFLINLYPNPCSCGAVQLVCGNVSDKQLLTCFNAFGQRVHRQEICSHETIFNVSTWSPGIYLAVVYAGEKQVGRRKFVVQ